MTKAPTLTRPRSPKVRPVRRPLEDRQRPVAVLLAVIEAGKTVPLRQGFEAFKTAYRPASRTTSEAQSANSTRRAWRRGLQSAADAGLVAFEYRSDGWLIMRP